MGACGSCLGLSLCSALVGLSRYLLRRIVRLAWYRSYIKDLLEPLLGEPGLNAQQLTCRAADLLWTTPFATGQRDGPFGTVLAIPRYAGPVG